MIVDVKDLSHAELVAALNKAIVKITELIEEKQRLEKAIKKACEENDIQYIRGLV